MNGLFSKFRGDNPNMPTPESVHICQVTDEVYNADAPLATANCGPAAAIMAMRMVGAPIPGEESRSQEALIEYIRRYATGDSNRLRGTTNIDLEKVLRYAGCDVRTLTHTKDMLRAVTKGEPVIMGGNPAVPTTYTARYDYLDIRRYDNGHWITVSTYDRGARKFIVNDPMSTIGPVPVTVDELYAFASKDGGVGLAISYSGGR